VCSNIRLSKLGEVKTMSKKELLASEIEQVPEPLLDELLDFVRFLKTKIMRKGWTLL